MSSSDYADKISKYTLVFDIGADREVIPYDESDFDRVYIDDYFNSFEEKEKFRSYWTQAVLYEGFDLELEDPIEVIGGIVPHPDREKSPRLFAQAETLTRIAVGMNNCRPGSKKVEFVEVQKLNTAGCAGTSYFITFLAKDCSSGQVTVYQTKINDLIRKEMSVKIFREKPPKSLLLMTPEEMSSLYLDEAKDYDGLVFEVEEDSEETSSYESESDTSYEDDVFDTPEPEKLKLTQGLDLLEVEEDSEEMSSNELENNMSYEDDVFDTSESEKLKLTQGLDLRLDGQLNFDLYATAEKLTRVAVGMNNCRPVSKKVEFVEVQKVDRTINSGFSYFITFLAKDCSTGGLMVYETKIQDLTGKIKIVIFREKSKKSGMEAQTLQS